MTTPVGSSRAATLQNDTTTINVTRFSENVLRFIVFSIKSCIFAAKILNLKYVQTNICVPCW